MKWVVLGWLLCLCVQPVSAQPAPWESTMSPYEQQNLRTNRQWIAQRRQQGEAAGARVGVLAGAGVWHLGARSLVTALERAGVTCSVVDPTELGDLSHFSALILPGGYAAYQYYALGSEGCRQVAQFTQDGGHVLGICAGGYLLSRVVRYDGVEYPYPLALFDGIADGPVAGLAVYPDYGPVKLNVTPSGRRLGLQGVAQRTLLYGSGPRFVGGSQATVLLTYPDGTAAAISRPVGKGQVVALGAHLECSLNHAEDSSPPPGCEILLLRLLGLSTPKP